MFFIILEITISRKLIYYVNICALCLKNKVQVKTIFNYTPSGIKKRQELKWSINLAFEERSSLLSLVTKSINEVTELFKSLKENVHMYCNR